MEAYREEEKERHGNSDKNRTPLLHSTKKRFIPTAGEKPEGKRYTKRRRFSFPFFSDEEIETGNESGFSDFTPSISPRSNRCGHLRPMLSTSGRGGKDILSMKGMRSRGVGGPARNISYNGHRPGWTEADSPRLDC